MRSFNKTNKFSKRDSGRSSERSSGERRFERRDTDRTSDRASGERRFERRDTGRSRESGFELHKAVCDKCGRECEVPFKPTGGKPIYCRSCFRENSSESGSRENFAPRGKSNDTFDSKMKSSPNPEDLEKINRKLDKIMKALKIE